MNPVEKLRHIMWRKSEKQTMKQYTIYQAGVAAGIVCLAGSAAAAIVGSEKYTYDASGNMIGKSIDGKVVQMSYDDSNRAATDASARTYGYDGKVLKSQGAGATEFFYNAEGALVGKRTDGMLTESYAWDGTALAAKGNEAYANESHKVGDVPVLAAQGEQVAVTDHLGTTLSSGGHQYSGTAYGEGLEEARFTGKMYVKELSAFVFPCRLYSPEVGRWQSADPSGFPDGVNNYVYVNGDPLSRVDPMGLSEWEVYSEPADPGNIGGNPPVPESDTWGNGVESTTDLQWRHNQWDSKAQRVGGKGEHLTGGFTFTSGWENTVTVGGNGLQYSASVSGSTGSELTYDVPTPANECRKVEGCVSKGSVYTIEQDWKKNNGQWIKDGATSETPFLSPYYYRMYGLRYSKKEA